jgi:hypothetical protein
MDKYGEKYSGDSKFVAECRKLQSIYRVQVGEAIRPYKGRDGKTHFYGNYIDGGEKSGKNFLTEYAFRYAKERVENRKEYETIDSDRLFNNLLSSQPMAFNLFCPLREMQEKSPKAATAAIKAALPAYPIHSVTGIDLEFIPKDYPELSGDKSAMDAIIRFVNESGQESFIAIETKYSENLGTNIALEKGTNRPRSQSLKTVRALNCFKPDIEERIIAGHIKLTQIYRNFLLSESYGAKYGMDSYSIILAPARNLSTKKEVDSLRNELREEYMQKIDSLSLEDFVGKIIAHCPEEYLDAFEKFNERYLDFGKIAAPDKP